MKRMISLGVLLTLGAIGMACAKTDAGPTNMTPTPSTTATPSNINTNTNGNMNGNMNMNSNMNSNVNSNMNTMPTPH